MIRRLIFLGFVAVLTLPASASRRATVAQLREALAADQVAHRTDAEVADQIGAFELTERLTDTAQRSFAAKLTPGPRSLLALQLLADQSAFLDPPAADIEEKSAPDWATQRQIMAKVVNYVTGTVRQLPNFLATRDTTRFEDRPQQDMDSYLPLHFVGRSSAPVVYRDGQEMVDTGKAKGQKRSPGMEGLASWGEFGPILSTVLLDAAQSKLAWSHWEQDAGSEVAVFRYEVPAKKSHYQVQFCCAADEGINQGQPDPMSLHVFHELAGYHGEIAVDPATGAMMRVTVEAELAPGAPLAAAAIMVQYRPVQIGGKSFICPVRSVALARRHVGTDSLDAHPAAALDRSPLKTLLNTVEFAHYHRLGTEMRILTPKSGEAGESPETSAEEQTPSSSLQPLSAISTELPKAANSRESPASVPAGETAAAVPVSAAAVPVSAAPVPAPTVPEIDLSRATGLPDQPADEPGMPNGYSLKVTSRLVDVGVVAYDKKGRPVNDLKADNFEIYDNGQKQEIRFFSQAPNAMEPAPASAVAAEEPTRSFSNRAAGSPATATTPAAPETGATILLIDESHIAWSDMNNARRQMIEFLGKVAPGERVGLYTMTGLGFRVLDEITTDHAALVARLQKFMPTAQSASLAQEEETRNRQHFDEVHNVADLNSVNGNHIDVPDSSSPIDPQLMTMGSNPARASLIILAQVARHLSAISGHKSLIWISSDNVFADWQDQAVAIDKSPKFIDGFALRAQEAMNDAHAAVYPFDVSQLETGGISADLQHQNVQLTPAAAETAGLGGGNAMSRSTGPGRITAAMDQDLHPIQGPVRQVAAATGGRVIRRSGDLVAALSGIVEDGRDTYMLSFAPQGPADGQYHGITVKLTGRRGLALRYRTGYEFEKEPATLKDRFKQAVWKPMDVSEIAVRADVASGNSGESVKIDIATGDLGLEQRGGRWMDKLDIFFIQRDDAGLQARVEGQSMVLRLKPATYQGLMTSGVPLERVVRMKPDMASLRVLVVDENSGRMGSVTIPANALGGGH